MSDDLVKLGWKIRSEELAEVDTPFGSYGVKDYAENGWRWFYCFDTYFDNDVLPCEDMAHGMSLAEEHWRDRVQPITKPLTDRIEELEADLRKMALDLIAADGQSQEAYQAQLLAEAKLAKAVTRLQHIAANKTTDELTVIEWDTYDMFTLLDACISEARTTLAELKGEK